MLDKLCANAIIEYGRCPCSIPQESGGERMATVIGVKCSCGKAIRYFDWDRKGELSIVLSAATIQADVICSGCGKRWRYIAKGFFVPGTYVSFDAQPLSSKEENDTVRDSEH